jgi:hypothetical protein
VFEAFNNLMGKNAGVTNSRWTACFQAIWMGIEETLSSSVLRSILLPVKKNVCKFPEKRGTPAPKGNAERWAAGRVAGICSPSALSGV